jgi:tetratricopeptide (TPR) repeat protein
VYRQLGDEASLLNVFIDVIRMFGEDSSWGRRGVAQAIAVSEQGANVDQQAASLHALVDQHPDLPFLTASARLRIADLYDEKGEQLKAIRELDRIVSDPPPFQELVERSYRRKAEILSTAERYQEAADAYAKLVELTGKDQAGLEQARRLMVLQLVRKAMKDRSIGEVRIAAKGLKRITEDYPESVEAHRGYIETKVMLNETGEVQERYTTLAKEHPDRPIYLYSQGLALSYSQPPNLPRISELIEQAIRLDPGISYFHQTLGWAYEQEERMGGKTGYLEKAEGEYRMALELNDGFQFPQVESNLLLNLGNTYLALNNFPEAYRHYRQRDGLHALSSDSMTELLYRKNFGEACFKVGKSDESLTQYHMALKRVPPDNKTLKAELLERIGLAQQDLGHYSEAVQSFSQAMEMNLELGNQKNLALLQRNIGVNLYNLSTGDNRSDREALKRALKNYFASLDAIQQFGVKEQKKGKGLFNLDIALGEGGSEAAAGFDREGEKKLMFSYIAGTYEKLSQPAPAREFYLKKLNLISGTTAAETDVARLAEKAVVLNRVGVLSHQLGFHEEALDYMRQSLGYGQTLE